MTKKTIVYIGGFELPDKNAAAHRVINNGKALRELGYNVVFIGIHKKEAKEVIKNNYFGFICYSIPYPNTSIEWFKYITGSKFYIRLMNEMQAEVHSIFMYNLPALSMRGLIKYAKKSKIKVYSDCTEWYEARKTEGLLMRLIKTWDVKYRMSTMNQNMDGIISISKFLHSHYIEKGAKSVLIPPLVDFTDEKWHRSIKNEKVKVNFIYAGSPGKEGEKDKINILIDAFYLIINRALSFHIHIVGLTEIDFLELYPTYKAKVKELEGSLTFYGRISHVEALALLKRSDYSIFYRENKLMNVAGFPTKFVEAITTQTAVITNQNSNITDYLKDNKNGITIQENSIKSIQEAILKALNLNVEEKANMKFYLTKNSSVFDYNNYLNEFKELLDV